MMREDQWRAARAWFDGYGAGFAGPDGTLPPLLQGKAQHSRRVAANAAEIATGLGLADGDVRFARTAGLLHDVGRFPQFRDHGTFSDPKSIDHGECGYGVLAGDPVFAALDLPGREELLVSVRYHNKRVLPEGLTPAGRRLTDVVRDADKLDIYKVILDALGSGDFERNETVFLGAVPDGPPNPAIVQSIREGRPASYADIRNRTDFALQLLSWAFDFAFAGTCRRLVERGWFDAILERLPDDAEARAAAGLARAFLMKRCEEGSKA